MGQLRMKPLLGNMCTSNEVSTGNICSNLCARQVNLTLMYKLCALDRPWPQRCAHSRTRVWFFKSESAHLWSAPNIVQLLQQLLEVTLSSIIKWQKVSQHRVCMVCWECLVAWFTFVRSADIVFSFSKRVAILMGALSERERCFWWAHYFCSFAPFNVHIESVAGRCCKKTPLHSNIA